MATTERYKNKQGEQQTKTERHNIVAWGGLAETCGEWLHKGKQVYIEGKLQQILKFCERNVKINRVAPQREPILKTQKISN